jgi:hypothetical protein
VSVVLDHELNIPGGPDNERLSAGERTGQDFVVVFRRNSSPMNRGNDRAVWERNLSFLNGLDCIVVAELGAQLVSLVAPALHTFDLLRNIQSRIKPAQPDFGRDCTSLGRLSAQDSTIVLEDGYLRRLVGCFRVIPARRRASLNQRGARQELPTWLARLNYRTVTSAAARQPRAQRKHPRIRLIEQSSRRSRQFARRKSPKKGAQMGFRKALRPSLEFLESKTVMSAGVGAGVAALSLDTPAAAKLARPVEQTVSLIGSAAGDYTSTLSKHSTGTRYDLSASGTVTPIGSAVVNGWFHTPGSKGGQDSGSLTIVGSGGTLKLKLTPERWIDSARASDSVNPGGPIRGLSTVNPGGPMIPVGAPPVNYFTYTVTGGTGQYAHDRGTGSVEVATTTGLPVPGNDNASSTAPSDHGSGQTTLTFITGRVPLPF